MNAKYKIGDIVKITDFGAHYPNYEKMAKIMQLKNWEADKYDESSFIRIKGLEGKIVAVNQNNYGRAIYGLEIKDKPDIIIGEEGIHLVLKKQVEVYRVVKFLRGELNAL